jgi:hypothetical protein
VAAAAALELRLLAPQPARRQVEVQNRRETVRDKSVIVALRQARNGDGSDASRAMQQKREAASMHGIVRERQVVRRFLRFA